MIEPTGSLTLSGLEVVYLSDALRNGDGVKAIEDEVACLRPLLLNLASAYRELVTPDSKDVAGNVVKGGFDEGPVSIQVTEAQAWLMRAKVRTGDLAIDGKTVLGVALLTKLYALLLEMESGVDVEVSAYEEAPITETRIRLKERYDAEPRWQPDENTYPD